MNKIALLAAAATALVSTHALARDPVAAGSSTVAPFASAAIERANKKCNMNMVYDSVGTGGGFKKFCGGVGVDHTDFAGASRAIKSSETEACTAAGVTDITEVKFGFDGIAFAGSKQGPELAASRTQIFLALAAEVPQGGKMVPNPYEKWSDIDPNLPAAPIVVIGPPPTSGTRDAFVELVMHAGCTKLPELKDADLKVCGKMREDGAFIEAGENDNVIVQRLEKEPGTFGIFGYSFLEENADKLRGATIDGVQPSFDTIASGKYPVSRPLFVYVKDQHMGTINGMECFVNELTSEDAIGDEGYLVDIGLIPLPAAEREKVRASLKK